MNIKIIIATHKEYNMPEEQIYVPLQVGKYGKEDLGYIGDNIGDNISSKNNRFCELTGLYWAWKNLNCDYLGLVHYRRYFTVKNMFFRATHDRQKCILTTNEASSLLKKYDIILPKKRKYYIESLYSHYGHTHYAEHLDLVREVIEEKFPDYLDVLDMVYRQKYGYMFNMYIMKKELSDNYCAWLFNILFELERRIGIPEYSKYQNRLYGRISEIIFNCWLKYQFNYGKYRVKEIGCIHMEKINWMVKGASFLKAKFLNEKYKKSF